MSKLGNHHNYPPSLHQPDHTQARPGWVARCSQLEAYLMPPRWLGGGRRVTLSLSPHRYWEHDDIGADI